MALKDPLDWLPADADISRVGAGGAVVDFDAATFDGEKYVSAGTPNVASSTAGLTSGILGAGSALGSLAGGIGGLITAGIQAETDRIRAKSAEDTRRFNAKMAEMQASRVMENFETRSAQYYEQVGKLIGEQRKGFAAQGVKVGTGVSEQVERETRAVAAENLEAMRAAAGQRALGFKAEAMNQVIAGQAEAGNLRTRADNTLIAGGANLVRTAAGAVHRLGRL